MPAARSPLSRGGIQGGEMSASKASVWFVALDSGDPDLLREAAASGRCPNVASLLARGSVATTTSPLGVYVGAIWPSFSTATGCARHGRACYSQLRGGTYETELYGAAKLRERPFWARANEAGKRVVIVDVPKSHFTGDVAGVQVVDWGTHDPEDAGFRASPAEFEERVRTKIGMPPFRSCDEVRRTAPEIAKFRDELVGRARTRERILAAAVEEADPDLVAVAFTESHCGGHQLWSLHDTTHERHDAAIRA